MRRRQALLLSLGGVLVAVERRAAARGRAAACNPGDDGGQAEIGAAVHRVGRRRQERPRLAERDADRRARKCLGPCAPGRGLPDRLRSRRGIDSARSRPDRSSRSPATKSIRSSCRPARSPASTRSRRLKATALLQECEALVDPDCPPARIELFRDQQRRVAPAPLRLSHRRHAGGRLLQVPRQASHHLHRHRHLRHRGAQCRTRDRDRARRHAAQPAGQRLPVPSASCAASRGSAT